MIYDCEKLPAPGLYIPEIVQEMFGPSDDGFRMRHFRHAVRSVAGARRGESSGPVGLAVTLFMYLNKRRLSS